MVREEWVTCSACFGGQVCEECVACQGHGSVGDEACTECSGSGEGPSHTCGRCGGVGELPLALCRLIEADEYVRRQDSQWDENDSAQEHPGVTVYSLAKWYRKRNAFGLVHILQGVIDDFGVAEVWLFSNQGKFLHLRGFAWGYGGEGPSGLAVVMTDIGTFPSTERALQWVARQPQNKNWVLRAKGQ